MSKPPSTLEVVQQTLDANCGMCCAEHLVQRGAYYGYTTDELREAAVGLGTAGITVDGIRYVALPSHKDQLQSWAEFHSSVVRYHRTEAEKEAAVDFIELDDSLPDLE